MKKILVICTLCFVGAISVIGQPLHNKKEFTHQDTLRGSITPEREWWDVLQYDITVQPDYASKKISGKVVITYKTVKESKAAMQIDLQEPMLITAIEQEKSGKRKFTREGNVYHVAVNNTPLNTIQKLTIQFEGFPRVAVNPPWDGGWVFTKDAKGRPWMTVACQGLGASVWYPCKDHQSDEPDNGASLSITVPNSLVAVANGRLAEKKATKKGFTTWKWEVKNPINNYNIVPYIGKYVNWTETYAGEKGNLDCSYWVLDYDLEKAKKHFTQARDMLKCFEYWFGPYPFYEDSYKMVEAPHLGMEHQSAVAYGNKFLNGYLGMDISGTGWGKKWDYIIIHESGHEWFANNITTKDAADMWVQEGFTCYSETLYTECMYGKEAGNTYSQGMRRDIQNDSPVIGPYGVNQEGSSDMYNKGNNILHTVRQVIDNDSLFRQILRGLNKDFYHKTVTSAEIENYISEKSGKDLSKIFDQYLRTTQIPALEYKMTGKTIAYHWANTIEGFDMPVRLSDGKWIQPTTEWKTMEGENLQADKNFYITVKNVE